MAMVGHFCAFHGTLKLSMIGLGQVRGTTLPLLLLKDIRYQHDVCLGHDDVIKWKHFPRHWPFVRGIHRSPVNSPHKGQWRGAVTFSLICAWIKRLSKQWWGWWFETPSRPLCRYWWCTVPWSRSLFKMVMPGHFCMFPDWLLRFTNVGRPRALFFLNILLSYIRFSFADVRTLFVNALLCWINHVRVWD